MSEEKKELKTTKISRREFLKDAGLIVGGATVGTMALVNACGGTTTTTVTSPGGTTTKTVTSTTTAGAGSTVTVTQPGATSTVTKTVPVTVTETPPATGAASTTLNVNGMDYSVVIPDHWSLAMTLREQLGLFGTKIGCDMGQCGACTVLVDGVAVYACVMLGVEAGNGQKITTIEGLSDGITLSPLQQKFYDGEAVQCGYCTAGFVMAAQGLLNTNPKPTEDDVRLGLSGHLCMCQNFRKSVMAVTGGV
jgi:aerobic-type carbon monoxide dehydrogenase small subunit (CoxS/CutS family)